MLRRSVQQVREKGNEGGEEEREGRSDVLLKRGEYRGEKALPPPPPNKRVEYTLVKGGGRWY